VAVHRGRRRRGPARRRLRTGAAPLWPPWYLLQGGVLQSRPRSLDCASLVLHHRRVVPPPRRVPQPTTGRPRKAGKHLRLSQPPLFFLGARRLLCSPPPSLLAQAQELRRGKEKLTRSTSSSLDHRSAAVTFPRCHQAAASVSYPRRRPLHPHSCVRHTHYILPNLQSEVRRRTYFCWDLSSSVW
jgi:hypothetical protein